MRGGCCCACFLILNQPFIVYIDFSLFSSFLLSFFLSLYYIYLITLHYKCHLFGKQNTTIILIQEFSLIINTFFIKCHQFYETLSFFIKNRLFHLVFILVILLIQLFSVQYFLYFLLEQLFITFSFQLPIIFRLIFGFFLNFY